jgi:hypothetical protein
MKWLTLLCAAALLTPTGCTSQRSNSVLMGDSRQRIELTGFSFETSEQGDTKVAEFAGHRAAFEPERVVIDGRTVYSGPYERAAINRGNAGDVLLTVDGKSVPVGPAQPRT